MIDKEFQTICLYNHNADSYRIIKSAYELGEKVVGIVHATGTGKSYNALQLAYDNKDKKIIYIVPSNGIIEHIKKIIDNNSNLNLERDFHNIEFRTYQSFISLSKEEIKNIKCDLLILDEFHHIGAPIWGSRIDTIVETHPKMKIFGMTAYTVRDRGTSYERDMANPDTDELFSGKIKSRYDLCDAMIDGVLPKPIYIGAHHNLIDKEQKLEEKVKELNATTREYQEYMAILLAVKRRIQEAPSIPKILRKNIKPNGKYIYFCPPCSEEGTNDIETIKKQALTWFKQFIKEEDIIVYTSTSDMGSVGKLNRDAFYDDVTLEGEKVDSKFRIMFAINQYNEGIHAPNIDGVIMGRGTTSDIVYFEQLGRALAVRGNTKEMYDELEKCELEELIQMCKSRDIKIKENIEKEEIIEKLIAPIIIDLAGNYEFIKELENDLKNRIKNIQSNGLGSHRDIKIRDASFDISIENQDLFEMLMYVSDKLKMTWEDYYNLAESYYKHHEHLNIPYSFKTTNGYEYDEEGIKLGNWINTQRQAYKGQGQRNLTEERKKLLEKIGMVFVDVNFEKWMKKYKLAESYYKHHEHLNIPYSFKTTNGYEYDEEGVNLGKWISRQRQAYKGYGVTKITEEQIKLLEKIGMVPDVYNDTWMKNYNLAKSYYKHHGHLNIPQRFKTTNGYEYDEEGFNLGNWIICQRQSYKGQGTCKLTEEQKKLLEKIGMVFDVHSDDWMKKYKLAESYYKRHGNSEIPRNFKTTNGYEYDEQGINLGRWISNQRQAYKGYGTTKITEEQIKLLEKIGMNFDNVNFEKWMKNYNLAESYYKHHGHLNIPYSFKITNGYEYDEEGVNLGRWINTQRQAYKGYGATKITEEQIKLLEKIGMNFDNVNFENWMKKYKLAESYYKHHGHLNIPRRFKTTNGYEYDEEGFNLGNWIICQRQSYKGQGTHKLTEEQKKLLEKIGIVLDVHSDNWMKKYKLAESYYEHHGNLEIPIKFKTTNGYEYDEEGINLGIWINTQRQAYKVQGTPKLTEQQIKLLEKIGMVPDVYSDNWMKKYNLAESYYNHYGHLNIPQNFKTTNGYEYDEQGVKLGIWIKIQRQAYKGQGTPKLTEQQIKLLEKIEMIWFDENTDKKLQNEIINEQNKKKKKMEILNRLKSYLNTLDENKSYSKEEINSGFVKKLNM